MDHPNILKLYEYYESETRMHIVLEMADFTLEEDYITNHYGKEKDIPDHVRRKYQKEIQEDPMKVIQILDDIHQVCLGIQYLHKGSFYSSFFT